MDKYSEDEAYYPLNHQQRALVNQSLFFDTKMYADFKKYCMPKIVKKTPLQPDEDEIIKKNFLIFDEFLEGCEYIIGDQMTIADLCFVTTVSTYEAFGIDISAWANVWNWYQNMLSTMPCLDIHKAGVAQVQAIWIKN